MSTLIAEQTLFAEVENHSVVRVFSLPSLAFLRRFFQYYHGFSTIYMKKKRTYFAMKWERYQKSLKITE